MMRYGFNKANNVLHEDMMGDQGKVKRIWREGGSRSIDERLIIVDG
jgi:hypothetical protein